MRARRTPRGPLGRASTRLAAALGSALVSACLQATPAARPASAPAPSTASAPAAGPTPAPSPASATTTGPGPLLTRWADRVDRDRPWPEPPRPQLRRDGAWTNLNGTWQAAIRPNPARGATEDGLALARAPDAPPPGDAAADWPLSILVPFCVEAPLSGVARRVEPDEELWYRRRFAAPPREPGGRVLLRFGAVDWATRAWVDGHEVGRHEGGYDAFAFDVTDALGPGEEHELLVRVRDPTDAGPQPRGKQVRANEGIWYTPTTGIWQTVWLEVVPETWIESLGVVPDFTARRVTVTADVRGPAAGTRVRVVAQPGDVTAEGAPGEVLTLDLPGAQPWSPDSPVLHALEVQLLRDGRLADRVTGHYGLRSIAVAPDADGVPRLMLNGKPFFQSGLLDQGFWPDGLSTPPTEEALLFDLQTAKSLGFTLLRKHVKVESQRYYDACDRLGILVWQDLPSGDASIWGDRPDIERSADSSAIYERELTAMVAALAPHPCVVAWVPFNEGWGQWDTAGVVERLRARDASRPIDAASGWTDRGVGDLVDAHVYPGPGAPAVEPRRAAVLGEYGGLGLEVPAHTWTREANWGYRRLPDTGAVTDGVCSSLERLRWLAARGLCAAVYTQLTDVETEVNGLLTYDRAVLKVDAGRVAAANARLAGPLPRATVVLETARERQATWRYRFDQPPDGWESPAFDDSDWPSGPGGFGTPGTPGAAVGTEWSTPAIWLRRHVLLDTIPPGLALLVHHDEDVSVFLDGQPVLSEAGWLTDYEPRPIPDAVLARLQPGGHVLALCCRQTGGGQFVDAGLVAIDAAPPAVPGAR